MIPRSYLHLPTPLEGISFDPEEAMIWCKLEYMHPTRSIKDRIAAHILEKAWRQGKIGQGSWVIEASSGSTSIAMAHACARMGLRFIACMPEGVSNERILIIRAFGGEVLFSPRHEGMKGACHFAEAEAKKRDAFLTRQFENPANPETHYLGTAQEILEQIPDKTIDAVVSGIGTGGTLVGLAKAFKEAGCRSVPYIAIPTASSKIGDLESCSFSGRIPGVLDFFTHIYKKGDMPDAVELQINDELALQTSRELIARGYPVGPSSGLNFAAARIAAKELGRDAHIVTVFPDGMEKYFSTDLFAPFRE